MKNFTPEDLLEFHYNEMPAKKRNELLQTLSENWSLRQKMDIIEEAAERLDKSIERPRDAAVEHILRYAAVHSRATL